MFAKGNLQIRKSPSSKFVLLFQTCNRKNTVVKTHWQTIAHFYQALSWYFFINLTSIKGGESHWWNLSINYYLMASLTACWVWFPEDLTYSFSKFFVSDETNLIFSIHFLTSGFHCFQVYSFLCSNLLYYFYWFYTFCSVTLT